MVPIQTSTVMLIHLTLEFGSPLSESASRVMPAIGIKTRNSFANAAYSPKDLPKIIGSSSRSLLVVEWRIPVSTSDWKNKSPLRILMDELRVREVTIIHDN